MELRLFVFSGFAPDYTDGLAFAIARDETEARGLIAESYGSEPYTWGDLTVHPVSEPIAFAVCGGG